MNLFKRDNINYYQQHLIVAMGFLMPLHNTGISFIASLMFLFFILDKNVKENIKYSLSNKAILALTIYFGVYIVWLIGSDEYSHAMNNIKEAKLYLLPIIIYPYITYKIVTRFALAFILGMLISEIYSYGIFFEVLESTKYGTPKDPTPFMSHIDYSMFLALTSLIVLQKLTISRENIYVKVVLVLYFITVTTNLFITGGRTGQAIFLIAIFVVLWLTLENKLKSLIYSAILATTIAILAINFSPNFQKRVEAATNDIGEIIGQKSNYLYTDWGNRLGAYVVSFHNLTRKPFFGYGTGDELIAQEIITKEENIHKNRYSHIHGQYNDAFLQFGIIGIMPFLFFLFFLFKFEQDDKDLKIMKVIFVIFLTIFSFTERVIGSAFLSYLLIVFSTLTMVKPDSKYVNFFSQRQIVLRKSSVIIFGKYIVLILLLAFFAEVNWYMNTEGFKNILKLIE